MKHTLAILTALLLSQLGALRAVDTPAAQPNIVFIISDDQGARDYGFMGHPHIQTPHIDKLAAQSLTFTNGFVPSSVCCPSLASIITGLYPHQHKVTANDPPLPQAGQLKAGQSKGGRGSTRELTARWEAMLDGLPTLPRLLAGKGYNSFQIGKWWQGNFSRGGFTHGMTQGSRHGDKGLTIGREGINPLDTKTVESRQQVFGEDFTIRSQTLDDPAANVLWRWVTDGRWRLVLPRTFEAEGSLRSIPTDKYLRPDLRPTLEAAQPMLYDLKADPTEANNIASTHPEIVTVLRAKLDAHSSPKIATP